MRENQRRRLVNAVLRAVARNSHRLPCRYDRPRGPAPFLEVSYLILVGWPIAGSADTLRPAEAWETFNNAALRDDPCNPLKSAEGPHGGLAAHGVAVQPARYARMD